MYCSDKIALTFIYMWTEVPAEVTCRRPARFRFEFPEELFKRPEFQLLFLDEVEDRLRCEGQFCGGRVKILLSFEDKMEGFVGGLA